MLRKSNSKETIAEKDTTLDGFPATVTVKEITRRRYNKPTWYGYGITVTFETDSEFTYRNTIEKSTLNRTFFQRIMDGVFDRNPPTSLSDFIIEVTHTAASEYRDEVGEITLEQQVEATLTAIE